MLHLLSLLTAIHTCNRAALYRGSGTLQNSELSTVADLTASLEPVCAWMAPIPTSKLHPFSALKLSQSCSSMQNAPGSSQIVLLWGDDIICWNAKPKYWSNLFVHNPLKPHPPGEEEHGVVKDPPEFLFSSTLFPAYSSQTSFPRASGALPWGSVVTLLIRIWKSHQCGSEWCGRRIGLSRMKNVCFSLY